MANTEFTIAATVRCSDGVCGHLTQLVVDRGARVVTHLVVEPPHRSGLGRLVPLDLVDTSADEIGLSCSMADFEKLERAEETGLLPGSNGGYGGYGLGQALPGAYIGRSSFGVLGGGISDAFDPVVYDTLPPGEVAVRTTAVQATDGDIGHVRGLLADRRDHRVTHVVLQEGHLWGRKQVAIPIDAVASMDDGIRLNLTKEQVEDLPAMNDDAPGGSR